MSQPLPSGVEDQLENLEGKIERTLTLLADNRQARKDLETENARLRKELSEGDRERGEIRRRVERLLKQVDTLAGE